MTVTITITITTAIAIDLIDFGIACIFSLVIVAISLHVCRKLKIAGWRLTGFRD